MTGAGRRGGVEMKKLGIALAMTIAAVGAAHAADLPTKKEVRAASAGELLLEHLDLHEFNARRLPTQLRPPHVLCDARPGAPIRVQRRGLEPDAAQRNGEFCQQAGLRIQVALVAEQPQPVGRRPQVEPAACLRMVAHRYGGNRISTPVLEFGQRRTLPGPEQRQSAALPGFNADSGRDGQWDNSQGFIGFSNPTYGTLVGGRVNTLGLDGLIAYDVMSSAYAFSPFGFSGSYAGFGDTELTRSNTAIKYNWNSRILVSWMNFHVAGLAQFGSYNQGNPSTEMWQGANRRRLPPSLCRQSFCRHPLD